MTVAVIGADEATITERLTDWSRQTGEVFTTIYKGPIDKAQALYDSLINGLDDGVFMREAGGVGTVIKRVSADETGSGTNDDWEVMGQPLYKDLRTHQTFNVDADQTDLENARLFFETAGQQGVAVSGEPEETYLDLLNRGTSEYVRSVAILQQTLWVSRRSAAALSWGGVDQAHRISGDTFSPNPPNDLVGVVAAMPEADATKKQWLKTAPQLRRDRPLQFGIVQQWWYARRWSNTLYSGDNEADNP